MPKVNLSINIETTSQPKQYHSIKMGVTIHEVEIDYVDDQDLEEKIMDIENKYQMILNKAKNLAIEKKLYSGKIETFYDEELKSEVSIKNGDQKTEEKQNYIESLDLDDEEDSIDNMEEVDFDDDLDLDF